MIYYCILYCIRCTVDVLYLLNISLSHSPSSFPCLSLPATPLKKAVFTVSVDISCHSVVCLCRDRCNPGDLVLLCLDEQHDHYVVFTVGTTLHFLHSDCLDALALRTGAWKQHHTSHDVYFIALADCAETKPTKDMSVKMFTKMFC